jgi:hypothetical protein
VTGDSRSYRHAFPDLPHWEPPRGRGPHDPPPYGLCPPQREAWLAWRNLVHKYDPRNPKEWPGGAHIMDSRTSHTARRRDWIEKSAGQMEIVERACALRGRQCDQAWHEEHPEEAP